MVRSHKKNYTDTCLFFSAYILFTLPDYIVDSLLIHVLTLSSPEKLVCQWRNRGLVSFGSHVESWTVCLAHNWCPVTFHGMSRTHENACHFSQWFPPLNTSTHLLQGQQKLGHETEAVEWQMVNKSMFCVLGISDIQGCGHGLYPRGVGEAGSCTEGRDAGELQEPRLTL